MFSPSQSPRTQFGAQQPPLPVTGIAVGKAGRLAQHTGRSGFLIPTHQPVVRNVAEYQLAQIAEPDRASVKRQPVAIRSIAAWPRIIR